MTAIPKSALRATQQYVDDRAAAGLSFGPVVSTIAALGAIGDAINTTAKAKNKLADDENGRTYKALGAAAGDGWRPLDDQSGNSDIIPA